MFTVLSMDPVANSGAVGWKAHAVTYLQRERGTWMTPKPLLYRKLGMESLSKGAFCGHFFLPLNSPPVTCHLLWKFPFVAYPLFGGFLYNIQIQIRFFSLLNSLFENALFLYTNNIIYQILMWKLYPAFTLIVFCLTMWNIKIKNKRKIRRNLQGGGNSLSQHMLIFLSRPERNT